MTARSPLRVERLFRAARNAERALPELVRLFADSAKTAIQDPAVGLKEKAAAIRALASIADMVPRLEDALGLTRDSRSGGHENPLTLVFNTVNVQTLKALDSEDRQRALLRALGGMPGSYLTLGSPLTESAATGLPGPPASSEATEIVAA